MRRGNTYVMLSALVVVVPALVGGAGLASFLLLRAGYGPLVWGLLPLLGVLVITGALGAILGRAAKAPPGSGGGSGRRPPRR